MPNETFVLPKLALRGASLAVAAVGLAISTLASSTTVAEPVIIISKNDCSRLVAHQPSADVAYTPGVDVRGRPVVPADLPGTAQVAIPEEIAIDVTVEVQERFGIPSNAALFKSEARVGTVVVKPDGSATFNGQPLTTPEQQALSALCQKQGIARR